MTIVSAITITVYTNWLNEHARISLQNETFYIQLRISRNIQTFIWKSSVSVIRDTVIHHTTVATVKGSFNTVTAK